MIKAVAFDLDDTLLRDDRSISDYTVEVLHRAAAKGVHVIPASGRILDSIRPFVERIGCASAFVCCNGAEVYAPDGTPLMKRQLSPELAREVAVFAAEQDCYAQTYEGDAFYYAHQGRYAAEYAAMTRLRGVHVDDLAAHIRVPTPKMLIMDSASRVAELLQLVRHRFGEQVSATCSKPVFLEINPPATDKGSALQWLSSHLGFSMDELMAFGDGLNDVSMLTAAGHGVAMDNARKEIKAVIPRHCLNNQLDGVARYIEEHVLQEAHS